MPNLTVKGIKRLPPGRHRDRESRGLYLQVGPTGTKSWLLRYELNGRERFMGLGALDDFDLKEARQRAREQRQKVSDGIDPIEAKKAARAAVALEAAKAITFEAAAQQYYDQHEGKWTNRKHAAQFLSTMKAYVFPHIGGLSVAAVDTGLVLKCVEPIWKDKTETASRVRNRIEMVLGWATVRGYRTGDNPARWRGHLAGVLPARGKIAKTEHHAALPFIELPGFWATLKEREGVATRALEFLILTAARSGEVLGATWDEIDLKTKVWTISASRMKGGRAHRVPLADPALKILDALPREDGNPFVFVGEHDRMGKMAMAKVMGRLGRTDVTVHGFRSTFRDWAAERTNYPNHVVEMALAHVIGNKVESAYRRGDLFEKRRKLMAEWARYCVSPAKSTGDTVIPIRRA